MREKTERERRVIVAIEYKRDTSHASRTQEGKARSENSEKKGVTISDNVKRCNVRLIGGNSSENILPKLKFFIK